MNKTEFYKILGKIESKFEGDDNVCDFVYTVEDLIQLVEEASDEDFYGTEGYEHRLGWD